MTPPMDAEARARELCEPWGTSDPEFIEMFAAAYGEWLDRLKGTSWEGSAYHKCLEILIESALQETVIYRIAELERAEKDKKRPAAYAINRSTTGKVTFYGERNRYTPIAG